MLVLLSFIITTLAIFAFMGFINGLMRFQSITDEKRLIYLIKNPCLRKIGLFILYLGIPFRIIGYSVNILFFKLCPNDKD